MFYYVMHLNEINYKYCKLVLLTWYFALWKKCFVGGQHHVVVDLELLVLGGGRRQSERGRLQYRPVLLRPFVYRRVLLFYRRAVFLSIVREP